MRPKDYKGRCVRQSLSKCSEIVRTYDKVQTAFARMLEEDEQVSSFQCNVPLEDFSEGNYTTDFLCIQNVVNSKNGKSIIGTLTQLINNSGVSICMRTDRKMWMQLSWVQVFFGSQR